MSDIGQIPNIEKVLGNRVADEGVTNWSADHPADFRLMSAACCSEASFLSSTFGPDFLQGEVTLEQFLEAFRVDTVPSAAQQIG